MRIVTVMLPMWCVNMRLRAVAQLLHTSQKSMQTYSFNRVDTLRTTPITHRSFGIVILALQELGQRNPGAC